MYKREQILSVAAVIFIGIQSPMQEKERKSKTTDEQEPHESEQGLVWELGVHAEQLGVFVRNNAIELHGPIGSFYEIWGARPSRTVDSAEISGSPTSLSFANSRLDENLAMAVMMALTSNPSIPATIWVEIDHGWVTLQGTANLPYQREEAERAVSRLPGVKGILSEIRLESQI